MDWIVASLLMFISSVVLYLLVRKSSLLKISSQVNNLAMFLIPLFVFSAIGILTQQNFKLSLIQLIIVIIASFFFSYLGNRFSLLSIEYAPNPGYSLVISKSYVVFTTLVSVLLFNSDLSLIKLIAILIIVIFSALLMLSDKNTKKATNSLWLYLSFGAFFCWGLLSLTSKYLFNQGINLYVLLSYVYLFVSLCILTEVTKKKLSLISIKKYPLLFILIGLSALAFNGFQFYAIKIAPNVGYVNAINAASISLVTIFATVFFKDELTVKRLLGVVGVSIGLIILLA